MRTPRHGTYTSVRYNKEVAWIRELVYMRMEALQANITASCPLAFGGVTGYLFARAVTAVITAHCGIFNDYKWPRDAANDIIRSATTGSVTYDFIIVGAGTAGSLLAGRLASLYPTLSVLLVEAGDDPGLDSEIPAFIFLNQNTSIDWHYDIAPDGKSCLGFRNNTCIWSKGKALGGSNSINAMLYVRGHPKDFEKWEESGNHGWGYDNLSTYFAKIENDFNFMNYKYFDNPWYGIIEAAWKELGFNAHAKDNDEAVIGMRLTKLLTMNGKRLNPAKLYLNGYRNLHVMKNTIVQRIIIDPDTKIVTGIELQHVNGIIMEISVTKEVILSAGTIGTPQILMLSGIGPQELMKKSGLKCMVDLSVGQNLQDHVLLPLFLRTNLNTSLPSDVITSLLLQYMMTKTGPFSNVGITDYMGFIDTENSNYPNIQFHHTYFTTNDNFMLKPYMKGVGYKEEIIHAVQKINEKSDLLGIYPTLLHPKSTGEILLSDKDPKSKLIIKANYFQHPDDINTFTKSIEFISKLETTDSFKALGIKLIKLNIPDCKPHTELYWECYIRHMATTVYHPVGTAKMGPRADKTTVVNHELAVHGVKRLRIVDASIMPSIPGGNTMASTLVIAEKAADIIKKQYEHKDEL